MSGHGTKDDAANGHVIVVILCKLSVVNLPICLMPMITHRECTPTMCSPFVAYFLSRVTRFPGHALPRNASP